MDGRQTGIHLTKYDLFHVTFRTLGVVEHTIKKSDLLSLSAPAARVSSHCLTAGANTSYARFEWPLSLQRAGAGQHDLTHI
jgi:hypothetical protein